MASVEVGYASCLRPAIRVAMSLAPLRDVRTFLRRERFAHGDSGSASEVVMRWLAFGLAFFLSASIVEASPTLIKIDPTRTYLRVNPNDPAGADAPAIDLAALGAVPGDLIRIRRLGTFTFSSSADPEAPNHFTGVFSSSGALADKNQQQRVIGAINSGVAPPFSRLAILFSPEDLPTDVPEDFEITDSYVRVPGNAAYLFVAVPDFYYADNVDADDDLYVEISVIDSHFDPRRTFLALQPDDHVPPPVIIDLQALGLTPGTVVHLEGRGDYTNWTTNHEPENGTIINAVFSSSSILLGPDTARRVPDAISVRQSSGTVPSYFDIPNDIPGDFWFSGSASVVVPPNARYLFVGVPDSWSSDNADLDGDLEVLLNGTPITAPPPLLPPLDSATPSFSCIGTCVWPEGQSTSGWTDFRSARRRPTPAASLRSPT